MPRRAQWIVAVFLYSVWALAFSASCARRSPELIAVGRLSPDRIAERDLLTISGQGFVTGAEAVVKFSGNVFCAAEPPRKVNVEHTGVAVDSGTIELQVAPEFAASFFDGSNVERATHATFRGEVRVSFIPRLPGAPPIAGKARDVVFDVFLARSNTATTAPAVDEPPAILDFLGITVEELGERGLSVTQVVSGKPAALAGIHVGDVITTWGDLRVHRSSDLEPFPGQRLVSAKLTRANVATTFPVVVPVEGFAAPSASGWWVGLVLLGGLVIPLLLSRSKVSEWLVWFAVGQPRGREDPLRWSARSLAIGPFLLLSAMFLLLAVERRLLPHELDLVWLVMGASMLVALFGVAAARHKQRFSLLSLTGVLVRQIPLQLSWWICVLAIVLEYGRASLWELSSVQTLDPRSFGAFTSPSSFLITLALLLASALLTMCSYATPTLDETTFWRKVNGVSRVLGDTAALLLGGVVIAVFLGGWSLRLQPPSNFGVGEALSFQLRFTLFYVGFLSLRRWLPAAPAESFEYFGSRWLLPLAMAALFLLPIWGAEIWPPWLRSGVRALLLCLAVFTVFGVPVLFVGLRRLAAARVRASGLNPWL